MTFCFLYWSHLYCPLLTFVSGHLLAILSSPYSRRGRYGLKVIPQYFFCGMAILDMYTDIFFYDIILDSFFSNPKNKQILRNKFKPHTTGTFINRSDFVELGEIVVKGQQLYKVAMKVNTLIYIYKYIYIEAVYFFICFSDERKNWFTFQNFFSCIKKNSLKLLMY